MEWIGDRFFKTQRGWIDAATGDRVRLHIIAPEPASDLEWDDGCARLANLRHPLLNPLLDYGVTPAQRFEAYACSEPLPLPAATAREALAHVTRFISAAGIELSEGRGARAMRPAVAGRSWTPPRTVGLTLQLRRALGVLEEALDAMTPAGPAVVQVSGAAGAGLRTLRVLALRSARLRGFTPVSAAVAGCYPELLRALIDRHVCVFDDLEDPQRSGAAVAQLIAFLAAVSPRRHLVVRFTRLTRGARAGVVLDPMPVRALIGMVFADGAAGPTEEALARAARQSDGLPGVFLTHLAGAWSHRPSGFAVHETPARYVVEHLPAPSPPTIGGRLLGGALRAAPRAAALAREGRHAAAVRVLTRGLRVLQGRERTREAATCARQLGWLALERGDPAVAGERFEAARALAGDAPRAVLCSIGAGVALTDANRLLEAEAVLRGALASAETVHDVDDQTSAAAALVRCLYWQNRAHEAIALVSLQPGAAAPGPRARLAAAYARCLARIGRTADAVRTAREGHGLLTTVDEPGVAASVQLALAEALIAAGDADGSRVALAGAIRLARDAHLPLVRVRALLLQARAGHSPGRALTVLGRVRLPPLLAGRVAAQITCTVRLKAPIEPVVQLELLLGLSQQAADDGAALASVSRAVLERLGGVAVAVVAQDDRLLVLEGRSWPAATPVVKEAFACGAAVRPDSRREPQEAAEPIRFGGEVVAVLGCRWTAGTAVDPLQAAGVLHAAALAMAPHVRGVLDRRLPEPPAAWADLLGESGPAVALRDSVLRAARAPFPVLIEGESGSGKELVARAVHRLGPRRDRRFCALNCAALTDDLVEAELFGHARGAFTGAATERAGLFEEADGGTLFLDEIGELSPRAQAKLLRVLQEGEVRRVGENMPRHVDVRIVAATNRRLAEEVTAGRFRADLRFRLDVVRLTVPPLRERASDIPLLAAHFWRDASARVGSQATLSPEALATLARYDWPGNVRELQNVIAWIAVHSPRRGRVGPSGLPAHAAQAAAPALCSFEAAREEFERRFIRAALAGANGQRSRAAEAIGVSRQGLAKMMRRLRLTE